MVAPINFLSGFINPSSFEWQLISNTQAFTSPLVGATQTVEMAGARWYGVARWEVLTEAQWRDLEGWLAQLAGAAGRFYMGPFHAAMPRGVGTGTPLVNGTGQTGRTLITDGWTPSQTGILKRGDYLHFDSGLGRELKIVTADVNSDALGQATLSIMPPIRTAPADNAAITIQSPNCIMRVKDDAQGKNMVTPPLTGGMEIEFVEAFV